MIVYVDVLILLNFLVDYFILLLVSKFQNINYKIRRLILASLFGGISSIYIFLNLKYKFSEVLINLITSLTICLIAFGYKNIKLFLKRTILIYGVSCLYAGLMFLIHKLFTANGILIHNSVVYLNISPLFLVIATVVIYFTLILLRKIFKTEAKFSKRAKISLNIENNQTNLTAIIDSGNSIEDVFSKSEIIIVDKNTANQLFKSNNKDSIKNRYRIIPYNTVGGSGCLEGYRLDSATINIDEKTIILEKPILAISKTELCDDYEAILNPKILEYEVI